MPRKRSSRIQLKAIEKEQEEIDREIKRQEEAERQKILDAERKEEER